MSDTLNAPCIVCDRFVIPCERCSYIGPCREFTPAMSVYNDTRCPKCGTTRNEHNRIYLTRMKLESNTIGGY